MISHKRLKEVLHYSPVVGVFEWRKAGHKVRPGFLAGTVAKGSGYVVLTVDGKRYRAHRLAWFYMTGEWPEDDIDHIDGDRSNNAFKNLRIASKQSNGWNRPLSCNSSSGVKGVTKRQDGKWQGRVYVGGKCHYAGSFEALEEAEQATKALREKLHGEFANHGRHKHEIEEIESESGDLTAMCG